MNVNEKERLKENIVERNQWMKKDGYEDTLNYLCAIEDIEGVIKKLVDVKKTILNKKCGIYGTPLNIACENGHLEIVKRLVEAGADLEIKNNVKETPLLTALQAGHEEIAYYLLEKGADLFATALQKRSALHCACSMCTIKMITHLLDRGSDINESTSDGDNVLVFAIPNGIDIVRFLLGKGVNKEFVTSAFITACRANQVEIAKLLLEYGADINGVYEKKHELLYMISIDERVEVVLFLLQQGIDFIEFKCKRWCNPYKESPLEFARRCKQQKVVEIITNFNK